MEQNLATPQFLGQKETGWLYEQTKHLHDLGVKLTYSGDQPFLLRLVLGISNDYHTRSMLPLYLSEDSPDVRGCDPSTGLRSDVKLNFRKEIPESSLVYFPHITAVTIDATHARTRCLETDLRKIVDKLLHESTTDYQKTVRCQLEFDRSGS